MRDKNRSPYTGYQSPGFRFCFHVRAISHRPLFLPLLMKKVDQIRRLMQGESPLTVFKTNTIQEARKAFCSLRKMFDFTYWAVNEYYIRDIHDADKIVPLHLNSIQHYLIDVLQKRYYNHQHSRYVVTKTMRPCGVTTCIQAYILWLQTCQCTNNSYLCSSSAINLNPLKTDICRYLKRDIVPTEPFIYIPKADSRIFFNTYRNPDFIRGINLGYVHFADMSKWKDPEGYLAQRAYKAAFGAVLLEYFTLIVLEGNIPKEGRFQLKNHADFTIPELARRQKLLPFTNNPYFLDFVANAHFPAPNSPLLHIDLDQTFHPSRRLQIPLINHEASTSQPSPIITITSAKLFPL